MHGKHEVIGSIPIVGSVKKELARERVYDIIRELILKEGGIGNGKREI